MRRSLAAIVVAVLASCSSSSHRPPGRGGSGGEAGSGGSGGAPCVPGEEVCNHEDDDCDGEVDEGVPTFTCGAGACATTVTICTTCRPAPPQAERCEGGIDEDCDGATDCADPDCVGRRALVPGNQVTEPSVAGRADGFAVAWVDHQRSMRVALFDMDGRPTGEAELARVPPVTNAWASVEAQGSGYLVARVIDRSGALDAVSAAGVVSPQATVPLDFVGGGAALFATPVAAGVTLTAFPQGGYLSGMWFSPRSWPADEAPWVRVQWGEDLLRVDLAGAGYATGAYGQVTWQPLDGNLEAAADPVDLGIHPGLGAVYVARSDGGDVVLGLSTAEEVELVRLSAAGELLESRTEQARYGGISPLPSGSFGLVDFPADGLGSAALRLRRGGPGLELGAPVVVLPHLRRGEQVYALLADDRVATFDGAGLMLGGASCE